MALQVYDTPGFVAVRRAPAVVRQSAAAVNEPLSHRNRPRGQ
ncbi:hypothetical protein KP77_00350 [Jeotgalibacillus alimentarius]|uniref:Uncharacterized protein n=1 Tax=Jeotgalibacillus alimentarius TaxID=135826 RepID=A0A0C2VXW9_9BACL|nr:hypothetical protein KP77_00350 [Jeotgalibacillus alimentarius]